jgi:RNA polymerase sigma factor (sigma-70 family)
VGERVRVLPKRRERPNGDGQVSEIPPYDFLSGFRVDRLHTFDMGAIARSDIELVEASLRGEHEAFGDLVARYQDVVCAVSYSSTGDRVLSEDVAQETFIAAWRQLDRLRSSERLRPWLCGIARNLARTARKRRRREAPEADAGDQIDSTEGPYDVAARGDVERVVRESLERIPYAYREALILYYREDMAIREIAETLGVSETTVMQRLSRGRRHLAASVTEVVESTLRGDRRKRDLVAAVLASIAVIGLPSRVDASPSLKGSTMLKLAIGASAVAVVATTAYLIHTRDDGVTKPAVAQAPAPLKPTLQYGAGTLGLAHAPTLGPTSAPRAIASRGVAEADLAILPADSEAVIGVNFGQLSRSVLWKTYVAPMISNSDGFREIEKLCGFDPMTSLGSISLGLKGLGDDQNVSGVIVIHGFERAKSMSCFDSQGVAEAEKAGTKVTIDDGVVLMAGSNEYERVAFTFIDNTTALVVIGPEAATKESVARIAAGNGGVHTSTVFASALQAINTDDSIWLMLADGSPLVANMNAELSQFTTTKLGTTYMSLNVTDSLALDAGLRLDSPAMVAKLVAEIEKKMTETALAQQVRSTFDQLDVIADGNDLILSVSMSGPQIVQLMALFSGLDDDVSAK